MFLAYAKALHYEELEFFGALILINMRAAPGAHAGWSALLAAVRCLQHILRAAWTLAADARVRRNAGSAPGVHGDPHRSYGANASSSRRRWPHTNPEDWCSFPTKSRGCGRCCVRRQAMCDGMVLEKTVNPSLTARRNVRTNIL
ncbi:hypothetical protein C8R44DRAFT_751365 [Mycena epipterygia]|nr:hypothetical protein C8R44DRAFT_751365 [Mycena epipterygia]